MMKIRMAMMALPLMAALGGCAPAAMGGANGEGGVGQALSGTSWILAELNGRPATATGGEAPTLQFDAMEMRASGNAGCNLFNGGYTHSGGMLDFGALASTRRACMDEAANAQETAYLQALESVTRYTMANGVLVLYAGDRVVAQLRARGA
jgi:heat shock protein HslJ